MILTELNLKVYFPRSSLCKMLHKCETWKLYIWNLASPHSKSLLMTRLPCLNAVWKAGQEECIVTRKVPIRRNTGPKEHWRIWSPRSWQKKMCWTYKWNQATHMHLLRWRQIYLSYQRPEHGECKATRVVLTGLTWTSTNVSEVLPYHISKG